MANDEPKTTADDAGDQPVAKKATAKKATAKKATAKKATAKKATAKKATAKKATAKKATAKKATAEAAVDAPAPEKAAAAKPARSAKPVTRASMSIDVLDRSGKKVGSTELPERWFGASINIPVMHQVVTAQLAAARAGTHKTKTRGEVAGGGRKPWRQKGTGRARQGSIRAPQWVGGGVAHGRVPKDWSMRVNKKVKRAALASALSDRAGSDAVVVVRDLAFEVPKTKDAVAMLAATNATGKRLVVLADWHDATVRSLRNLTDVHFLVVDQLNTYDVLASDVVVIDEAALELIGTGRRSSTDVAQEVGA